MPWPLGLSQEDAAGALKLLELDPRKLQAGSMAEFPFTRGCCRLGFA